MQKFYLTYWCSLRKKNLKNPEIGTGYASIFDLRSIFRFDSKDYFFDLKEVLLFCEKIS